MTVESFIQEFLDSSTERKEGNLTTRNDDNVRTLLSYAMPVAWVVDAQVWVIDIHDAPSLTTQRHVSAVRRAVGQNHRLLSIYLPPRSFIHAKVETPAGPKWVHGEDSWDSLIRHRNVKAIDGALLFESTKTARVPVQNLTYPQPFRAHLLRENHHAVCAYLRYDDTGDVPRDDIIQDHVLNRFSEFMHLAVHDRLVMVDHVLCELATGSERPDVAEALKNRGVPGTYTHVGAPSLGFRKAINLDGEIWFDGRISGTYVYDKKFNWRIHGPLFPSPTTTSLQRTRAPLVPIDATKASS